MLISSSKPISFLNVIDPSEWCDVATRRQVRLVLTLHGDVYEWAWVWRGWRRERVRVGRRSNRRRVVLGLSWSSHLRLHVLNFFDGRFRHNIFFTGDSVMLCPAGRLPKWRRRSSCVRCWGRRCCWPRSSSSFSLRLRPSTKGFNSRTILILFSND